MVRCSWRAAVGVLGIGFLATGLGQTYPNKPVRLIVPTAAGGGPDINARLIAGELGKQLGQQVVVDNRPGASGVVGFETLARAAPDGYTLARLTSNFTTNPSLFVKLPYDRARDIQPIIFESSGTFLLTVTPALPIRSVKELIEHARAYPGKLSYGSVGVGGPHTLAVELLKSLTGTSMTQVAYKGAQPAITDAIGGQIQVMCDLMVSILPHVRSTRLRGLGVTSLKRSSAVPELPTIAEAGVAGYEMTTTGGYAVPTGVPRDIVMRLNAGINTALQSPAIAEKFAAGGATIVGGTPEYYAETIRAETAKWAKVIKAAGIKPQ